MKHILCGGWGIFAVLKQYVYCSYDWSLSGYCSLYFSQGCATIPWTCYLVLLTEGSQGSPIDVSRRCSQIFTKIARWSASPRILIGVHGQKRAKSLGHCCKIFSCVSFYFLHTYTGTAVAQWLRYCATNKKVAGSIPDGVMEFFIDINPSDRTVALGST
jgi:hypothetical protein